MVVGVFGLAQYPPLRRDMTYILGCVYQDGVVLVRDRKVSEGTEVLYERKIFNDLPPIVVGSSGVSDLFHKLT